MRRLVRRLYAQARLSDPAYRFLFDEPPHGEVVAIDCETTGLDPHVDEIIAIAAIRIRDDRILTSERFQAIARTSRKSSPEAIKVHQLLDRDIEQGRPIGELVPELLRFIGPRPVVGYYTAFDKSMISKYTKAYLGIPLPNEAIDISGMYYDLRYGHDWGHLTIDLSFRKIAHDLEIPMLPQHDAFNDALMTAMMYLQLRDMARRGVRIAA
ncbi:3'-5' exonuclease [Methylobacterium dankookense]|uniref:DNA polymerase III PolC-type n=1 Tax=Methylobacterium dankookense TaxID=560405 RepID=A0A564G089_9HYPH|nr:3'-5' exonuclease [Methylobacterium dankookense]GJD55565.1 DNA polymerase III PolC-type [Methylobacterium dankookense]VUF13835.1 DNA polymerase III PolC-type [Methylobacterium dankookense]